MTEARLGRVLGLFGCLVLLLTGGGCAGGWQQMKTKRITGYAEIPRDFRYTMTQLEYGYAALSAFFPKAQVGTVEVLFMPGIDVTLTFGETRGPLVFPFVPGIGQIGRRNLIVMGPAIDHYTSTYVLSYLFVHQVMPNAPLWLQQSLASYFGSAVVQAGKDRWRACFGFPQPLNTRFFQMPLDKFFANTWHDFPDNNPSFYQGTGLLLIDYIFHGDSDAHRNKLPGIFAAAARGTPGPQIMSEAFPNMDLKQLGQRISDFKGSQREQRERGVVCPIPMPIDNNNAPDESDPQESPVAKEEIESLIAAIKKLPHGPRFPSWYPLEIVGTSPTALQRGSGVAQPPRVRMKAKVSSTTPSSSS